MDENENGTNVKLDENQLVRANTFLHALEPYGQVQVVREMARRIQALDKSKVPLNGGEAAHLAQLAISHDLNPFSGEIWGWIQIKDDKRHFSWMPGRRGIIRHANEQAAAKGSEWWSDERELTEHEKTTLMIPKDALAFESRVFDKATMDEWRKNFTALIDAGKTADEALRIGGNPPCSTGIGVLTQDEIRKMPYDNKMPHVNRAKKRALMEALKGKYSLNFGGAAGGAGGDTFEDYIVDSKGAIDVDFEDVTDHKPYGIMEEEFGSKERLDPKSWKKIPDLIVSEGLANDPFVVAEILAYSPLIPGHVSKSAALEFFQYAKSIYAENETLELKELSGLAYAQMFKGGKDPDPPQEAPRETPQEAPKDPPQDPPRKSPKEIKVDDAGLTANEVEALAAMAVDYPKYTPKTNLDWETAYKYIDLKTVTTSREKFQEIVKELNGDVRLGMARMLGYL